MWKSKKGRDKFWLIQHKSVKAASGMGGMITRMLTQELEPNWGTFSSCRPSILFTAKHSVMQTSLSLSNCNASRINLYKHFKSVL